MDNDLIKQGAYYLLRGGTLLSEPCKKCGNLQIKYKEDVICMNCQHAEQHNIEQRDTLVNNIETKKVINKTGYGETDEKTLYTFDDFQEMLCQVENQILQSLVKLDREQNPIASPKRYKKYLEIIQTGLKTIEMIRNLKKL